MSLIGFKAHRLQLVLGGDFSLNYVVVWRIVLSPRISVEPPTICYCWGFWQCARHVVQCVLVCAKKKRKQPIEMENLSDQSYDIKSDYDYEASLRRIAI